MSCNRCKAKPMNSRLLELELNGRELRRRVLDLELRRSELWQVRRVVRRSAKVLVLVGALFCAGYGFANLVGFTP